MMKLYTSSQGFVMDFLLKGLCPPVVLLLVSKNLMHGQRIDMNIEQAITNAHKYT
jgi:hypothetical protein